MIRFSCPYCNKKLKAPLDKAGAKAMCTGCKNTLLIPAIANPVVETSKSLREKASANHVAIPYPTAHTDDSALQTREIIQQNPKVDFSDFEQPGEKPQPQARFVEHESNFVRYMTDGTIEWTATTKQVAKLAISEPRRKKKELALAKRTIMHEKRIIRAGYTDMIRRRGSKFPGSGTFGRVIRVVQTISRDSARAQLAADLAPLDQKQADIDRYITSIDYVIIQIESIIHTL